MPAAPSLTHPATFDSERIASPDVLAALAAGAARADETGRPDAAVLDLFRTSELPSVAVPEEHGGLGAPAETQNLVVAAVAKVNPSAAIMLFQHYAVCSRIAEWGSPQQRERLLPLLASGQWLAASAWSETGAGANKKRLATTAAALPDGDWMLNGAKAFTTSAGVADIYLVLAQTATPDGDESTLYGSTGQTFFLVTADNPGLRPDLGLDLVGMRGSATGFVDLCDCRVTTSDVLGPLNAASTIIAGVRESGATLGAVSVGIAEAAVELVEEHGARRALFQHQAFRHRLVDLRTQVEAARAIVVGAGRRASANPGLTTLHSKLFASQVAEQVCAEVGQILGSAGYVTGHPLNRLARDARAVALMGPTNELCRELVGAEWAG